MSLLRLHCFPSTCYYCTERKQPQFHVTPFLSLHKQQNQRTDDNISLSSSLSLAQAFRVKPKKFSRFVLHFSATTRDSVVDSSSSSLNVDETTNTEQQEEEFSKTRLIAQNVPWTCTHEDIRALFEKHGTVLDVELSMYNKTKNRGLAFVTMGSPEDAVTALKNLESYEFEGRTLKVNYAKPKKIKPAPVQPKPVPTFNVFVANLSFEARAKDVKEFFVSEGWDIVSAEVIFHNNPRRSSGYGFVSFKTRKDAEVAISTFQGKIFMGRPLRVAPSRQFVKVQTKDGLQPDDTSANLNSNAEESDTTNGNRK